MNYIAHWHYARQQLQTPQYCLGLIWPDLSRTEPDCLLPGIHEHKALDMRFHSGTWMTVTLPELCKKHKSKLACHIALELAIDRLLLHAHPQLVGRVEELLTSPDITPFLEHERLAATMVTKIVEGRLHMYGTSEGCYAVLQSIMKRFGKKRHYRECIMVDAARIVEETYDALVLELSDSKA